jgi:hypothetical protein
VSIRVAGALVTLSALVALLSACGPAVRPTEALPTATQPATPSLANATFAVAEASPVSAEIEPPSSTPTARSGQEATDPTTVSLAAGRPALVKFFAFW